MVSNIKTALKGLPLLGPLAMRSWRACHGTSFSSKQYWESRYKALGNSGAGSYGRLAEFKADFLNRFVDEHKINTVIEYGCGDGAQLSLAKYPFYIGVDVSATIIEVCRARFSGDISKTFLLGDNVPAGTVADLSLSLDVIFHLVEDHIYNKYMKILFASARQFVIVYSSNINKNWPDEHVRHRDFTRWVDKYQPEWFLEAVTPNRYPFNPEDPDRTSFADFYLFCRR